MNIFKIKNKNQYIKRISDWLELQMISELEDDHPFAPYAIDDGDGDLYCYFFKFEGVAYPINRFEVFFQECEGNGETFTLDGIDEETHKFFIEIDDDKVRVYELVTLEE